MSESLAAANAAFEDFKQQFPDAAIYFCFLAGFVAGTHHAEGTDRPLWHHNRVATWPNEIGFEIRDPQAFIEEADE